MSAQLIALVGCGRWGGHILRDLVGLGCVVTVVARSAESRQRATDGGAAVIVHDVSALSRVDGVVIATPATTHAPIIEQVADLGAPMFVEKPLATDPESAARIAGRFGARVFVMDKWRYHPGIEAMAQFVRSGEFGPALGLHTIRLGWGTPHPDVDCLTHLAPHDLAIALEIFGFLPEPHSALAAVVNGVATSVVGLLGRDPWLICEISDRWPRHHREVRLRCRDALVVLPDSYSPDLEIVRTHNAAGSQPNVERWRISDELPLLRELRAFVEYLAGGPPPRSSAAEGKEIVRAIAQLRSLATTRRDPLSTPH